MIALECIALVDCEASSLRPTSYPIEVGWCLADTVEVESHLITPMDDWDDWDPASEALHGISRELLAHEGRTPVAVAERMLEALEGRDLYADGTLDQRWLNRLFPAVGLPPPALKPFDKLLDAIVGLESEGPGDWLARELGRVDARALVIGKAYVQARTIAPKLHRAGADARHLCEILRNAVRLAAEEL